MVSPPVRASRTGLLKKKEKPSMKLPMNLKKNTRKEGMTAELDTLMPAILHQAFKGQL
jgi:hypothetical protein